MYAVKLTIKPSDPKQPKDKFRTTLYEGLYCEKSDSKLTAAEIKKYCIMRMRKELEPKNKDLVLSITASARKLPDEFVFLEGKE